MKFDVVIVGGGITGTALAYVLSRYTPLRRIAIVEMAGKLGSVNTDPRNNSQTLHDGSIETNYTPEKARKVSSETDLLVKYLNDWAPRDCYSIGPKMVVGFGNAEVAELRQRFVDIQPIFNDLELLEREEIWYAEPKVIEGRDPNVPIVAIARDGYSIDFRRLSQSFVEQAAKSRKLSTFMKTRITNVCDLHEKGYLLTDDQGNIFCADVVVFATGPHSLLFAKQLGYAKHLGLLPVAGSFFSAPKANLLKGKVYTVQKPKLPFAAVHGDPEIFDHATTRFGPTAKVLPMLMRHRYDTVIDFFRVSVPSWAGIMTLVGILADPIMFTYMAKNLLYDLPIVGKWFFLQDARKIIPTLKYSDLVYNAGFGGIRPQIVNTETRTLEMGDAQVVGRNILFNVTPSPGASVCLANAYKDTKQICDMLGVAFHAKSWEGDYAFHPDHAELVH